MSHRIDRAAVLGAGVMGATLAAHLANAGIPTLLLDIVPPKGADIPGDPASRAYRDAFANKGLERVLKMRPAAFYTPERARLITTGNIEDDVAQLGDIDFVLEAVPEVLAIKAKLFQSVQPHLKESAILASNTSGLSVEEMAQALDEPLRKRFLVTHFFNPPRYMHLLEIVPNSQTDTGVIDAATRFCEDVLGKGVVIAKDTPNFIANRIGSYSMAVTLDLMLDKGYTPEEVDALTGPLIGRPKTASLRTLDMVGIDIYAHTLDTVYERATDDEQRDRFKTPPLLQRMIKDGMLGNKTGKGFYEKIKVDGKSEIMTLDADKFEYRPKERAKFMSIETAKAVDHLGDRIRTALAAGDRGSEFLWAMLSDTLLYAANRVREIADNIVDIDRAMRWGFAWDLGPFELWDVLGVAETSERMKQDGKTLPTIVEEVIASESGKFYSQDKDFHQFYFAPGKGAEPVPAAHDAINLARLKEAGQTVKANADASLIDIGDGVLCLEFHSKMNAIGGGIVSLTNFAVKEVEKNHEALIIGNQSQHFSVGANLMLLMFEAQEQNFEEIDLMVRTFQRMTQMLKYSAKPVVAAPYGMALGGGCEVVLGAGNVYASAETYMGLVEMGVGLIPAGGGTAEMLMRNMACAPKVDGVDYFPYVRAAFETIGMAKVSTSGEDARGYRFLQDGDNIAMNPDKLLYQAKQKALGLARQGYRSPERTVEVPAVGESGIASIKTHLYIMKEGKFISEYDAYLGEQLATILCGGRVLAGTMVSEQHLLDLEREVFLRLTGQRKSLERIQFMLKKGKPLRN